MKLADAVAESKGWEWRQADVLEPGDVQEFAGRCMTVRSVHASGRHVVIAYKGARTLTWPRSTELAVVR